MMQEKHRRLSIVKSGHVSEAMRYPTHRANGNEPMTRLGSGLLLQPPTTPPPAELCWTCHVCGDVPPLALPTGRWIQRSCACQRETRKAQEYAEMRQAWMNHQAYRTFGGWLGERWVDDATVKEMKSKTFPRYDPAPFPEAYKAAWKFAEVPKGNMVLYGSCGVGKTHLEAAILNSLRETKEQTSLFVSAPQFFLAYNDALKSPDMTRQLSLMQQIIETPVLVIDDLDKLKPTEHRHETYWLILDERYKAKRPTIVSTNKIEDLDQYIGEASASRLQRGLVTVEMIGTDYRSEEG